MSSTHILMDASEESSASRRRALEHLDSGRGQGGGVDPGVELPPDAHSKAF